MVFGLENSLPPLGKSSAPICIGFYTIFTGAYEAPYSPESLRQFTDRHRQQTMSEGQKPIGETVPQPSSQNVPDYDRPHLPSDSSPPLSSLETSKATSTSLAKNPTAPPGTQQALSSRYPGSLSARTAGLPPIVPPTTEATSAASYTAEQASNNSPYIHANSLYPEQPPPSIVACDSQSTNAGRIDPESIPSNIGPPTGGATESSEAATKTCTATETAGGPMKRKASKSSNPEYETDGPSSPNRSRARMNSKASR